MTAVIYRLRSWLRSRTAATLLLSLVVAAFAGVALAVAAGAERTSTVPDRFSSRWTDAGGVMLQRERGRPVDAIAGLPAVASVASVSFVFGGLGEGDARASNAIAFAGDPDALQLRITSGRAPTAPSEFLATRTFVHNTGMHLGETTKLSTFTQEQADANGFGTAPGGPTVEATLVGVVENPAEELSDPTPVVLFPSSLFDLGDVGVASTLSSVKLRDGATIDELRQQLDTLPEGREITVQPLEVVSSDVRRAVDAQSLGLWALAAVAAIATIAVLGQIVGRQVRMTNAEQSRLSAIGTTASSMFIETTARALLSVVAGIVGGVVLAILASPIFPLGFAGQLEPDQGLDVDVRTLVLGAIVLTVGIVGWVAVSVFVRGQRAASRARPGWIGAATERLHSAKLSTGVRFAFSEQPGDVSSPRAAAIGLAVVVATLVGAATFGSSLARLVGDESRYGSTFDFAYDNGADSIPADVHQLLESSPDVAGVAYVATSQTRRGSVSIPILGVELAKGHVSPAVLSGRTPVAPDEVALGRLSADDANVGVGDTIELSVAAVTKPFRVTGLVVVPDVGGTDQVGVGGVMTIDALHQLDPAAQPSAALVNLTAGVSVVDFVTRDLGLSPELVGVGPQPPGPIRNVGRVRPIPVALAVLMGVLAVVTVVNVLFTSIRRRRRQLAVMRAVGADRGWVGSICRWQAIAFTIVPAAIGSVLGVVAAAALFRRFADSIGAVDDASVPFIILAAMTLALVGIGVLTAMFSAARELHHSPAAALRSE